MEIGNHAAVDHPQQDDMNQTVRHQAEGGEELNAMTSTHRPAAIPSENDCPELKETISLVDPLVLRQQWVDGGLAILDPAGQVLQVNEALASWLGVEPQVLVGKTFRDVLAARHPDWPAQWDALCHRNGAFLQTRFCMSVDGRTQWLAIELTRSPHVWFARLASVLPPASELAESAWPQQAQSESAQRAMFVRLVRAEAQLDNLVHRWPGVIFSQRADFTFQFVSPKIEELTGFTRALWGRSPERFWTLVHEADVDELKRQIKLAARVPEGVTTTYRIRHASTGQVTYILEHRHAIVSGNGLVLGYEGVWLDVTRQTIAENRLSSAAWKETLAVLTMGLAHDFSNIMAGIHSLSESYLAQVDSQHPFYEGLALIKQHSLQASQLVQRIIQLHHGKTGERNYHNLNDIILDVVDLARKILPRRVRVSTELSAEPLPLYVDAVEFCQAILNLTLNAADAMPTGGKLHFRTSAYAQLPPLVNYVGKMPRLPAICLAVEDTGCGIPARHLALIFDPFFTTKAMDKGSGLGLYNARLFAEKHQGAISVESTEKVGTTFCVWLPQADFSESERVLTTPDGKRASLLLVGTRNEIMDGTAEFLRIHGYHVVMAHSHEQALEWMDSPDCHLVGSYVLANARHRHLKTLMTALRTHPRRLRTILQITGCNQDELKTQLLEQADLVLTADLSEEQILHKLKLVLADKI